MIADEYLGKSRLFARLKSGPHGHLVELYAACLVKDGLARQGTWRCLSLAGALLDWIARSRRSKLADLDDAWPNDTSDSERGSSPSSRATGRR